MNRLFKSIHVVVYDKRVIGGRKWLEDHIDVCFIMKPSFEVFCTRDSILIALLCIEDLLVIFVLKNIFVPVYLIFLSGIVQTWIMWSIIEGMLSSLSYCFWMSLVIEANMILRPCCCPHATSRTSDFLRAKTLLIKSPGAACPRHSLALETSDNR